MIKFLDLKNINARFEDEFHEKFQRFLSLGQYILGEEVNAFEREYAKYCGTKHCIGVSSGLDALQLIFEAYKILGKLKDGDEIIVPANTYIASILAISHKGLKPVLVEPNLETYNISPSEIIKFITPKTKAILGVHLYGRLYDVSALEKISKEYNLLLIEDAAQAHGAIYSDGRKAGNVSHAAAFSFYPTKNLGALGDAGAITTNDKELEKVVFKLRNYGRVSTNKNNIKGHNCRLDELQAIFLRIKLKHLNDDNQKRREIAKSYCESLSTSDIFLPDIDKIEQHVFHQFIIRSKRREKLKKHLLKSGIETLIHYPIPCHKQIAYLEFKDYKLPITEKIHNEVLSLPVNPLITFDETEKIITVINNF